MPGIGTIAVIGAGVMGRSIADPGSLANARAFAGVEDPAHKSAGAKKS